MQELQILYMVMEVARVNNIIENNILKNNTNYDIYNSNI